MGWSTEVVLGVSGGLCGAAGSIMAAFSVNHVVRELHLAQRFLQVTVEALAMEHRDVPVFTGTERRFEKAETHGATVIWFGVALLALG